MEKKKILIIDDEVGFTQMVKLNLEATGEYVVRTENKGSGGLAAAKEFKPDLILLDIIMPDMPGGDVAFQLNNDKETEEIPIVLLTAIVKTEEVEAHKGIMGGLPIIAKPVTVKELIDCIEKNMGKK
mgnify:CR=1 FL=1